MKNNIEDILCDMKCMETNKVILDPMDRHARIIWGKLVFRNSADDQTMYTDIQIKNVIVLAEFPHSKMRLV
jgi:glycyl-tRNA synthetase beta subunit